MAGTWSYNPTDAGTSEKDAIRLEIGDTDSNNWLLADEEINYAITQERNFWAAAARCAEIAARSILRKADPKLGRSMQVIYTKAALQYYDMARRLRCKAMGTVVPYIGGMNINDKENIGTDSSLVAPMFTKTMMENPWVGGYTTDSGPSVSEADSTDPEIQWL